MRYPGMCTLTQYVPRLETAITTGHKEHARSVLAPAHAGQFCRIASPENRRPQQFGAPQRQHIATDAQKQSAHETIGGDSHDEAVVYLGAQSWLTNKINSYLLFDQNTVAITLAIFSRLIRSAFVSDPSHRNSAICPVVVAANMVSSYVFGCTLSMRCLVRSNNVRADLMVLIIGE